MAEVAALGVAGEAVDRPAFFDQPAAAARPGRPVAADRDRRRAGDPVGGAVVADVGGAAALHPVHLAGVAEGLELLFAAEVEGDRGAAADRVGDVDAFGVGLDLGGADVEVGVAELDPLFRRRGRRCGGRRRRRTGRGRRCRRGRRRPAATRSCRRGRPRGPVLRQWAAVRTRRRLGELIAVAEQKPCSLPWRTKSRPLTVNGGTLGSGTGAKLALARSSIGVGPVEGRGGRASGPGSSRRGRARLRRAATGRFGLDPGRRGRRRRATARRARSPRQGERRERGPRRATWHWAGPVASALRIETAPAGPRREFERCRVVRRSEATMST